MADNQLWTWELDALNNRPMPDGLALCDQAAYTAMRYIYRSYKAGDMTRDQAAKEKQQVHAAYTQEKGTAVRSKVVPVGDEFWRKLHNHQIAVTMATECAMSKARKEPSLEALRRLLDVMDGLTHPWIETNAQAFAEAFLATCEEEEQND